MLKPGQLTTTPWSEEEGIQLANYRYIQYIHTLFIANYTYLIANYRYIHTLFMVYIPPYMYIHFL